MHQGAAVRRFAVAEASVFGGPVAGPLCYARGAGLAQRFGRSVEIVSVGVQDALEGMDVVASAPKIS